jgi:hypothetical protein
VFSVPAVYKGFKIKRIDVHDKSTEKSESETLSALLSNNYEDSYHIKVNISNSTACRFHFFVGDTPVMDICHQPSTQNGKLLS